MSARTRLILGALLLVATAAVVAYLLRPGTPAPTPLGADVPSTAGRGPLLLQSSAECKACHPEVYEEWKGSHHAFSWLNPEPRRKELSDNFKNKDCISCHAPRPMIEVGLIRPLEREEQRDDGVNCFTCHRYKNVLAAANDLTPAAQTAPCNPVVWRPVATLKLCAPCHDQHKVHQDWMATEYAVLGPGFKDCNDCHMPERAGPGTVGGPRRTHASHGFPGAHDPETLKRAATLEARASVDADGVRWASIVVANTGVGHNLPADERHRAVDVNAVWIDAQGTRGESKQLARFRNPYRHEFDILNPFKNRTHLAETVTWDGKDVEVHQVRFKPEFNPDRPKPYPESTQLLAGEARGLFFRIPDGGARRLEIRLYYRANPFMSDAEAVLMAERTVELTGSEPLATAPLARLLPFMGGRKAEAPQSSVGGAEAEVGLRLKANPTARLILDETAPRDQRLDTIERLETGAPEAVVEALLLVMKDKSQEAFVLDPDDSADAYRVVENPYGGPDTRADLRWTAILALERLGVVAALPDFAAALEDRHPVVRNHAARALWRLGSRSGLPVLVASLAGKAFQNETADRFLREITGMDAGFDTDSGFAKKSAAEARWREIVARFEKTPRPPLRRGYDALLDRRMRMHVAILGQHQFLFMEHSRRVLGLLDEAALDHVAAAFAERRLADNQTLRAYAAQVLGTIHAKSFARAGELLLRLLGDPEASVRARAADALGAAGAAAHAAAVEAPLETALADADDGVVVASIRALGRLGLARAAPRIRAMLDDRAATEARRFAAAAALLRLGEGGGAAGGYLFALLESGPAHRRAEVLEFLTEWKGEDPGFDPARPPVDQPPAAGRVRAWLKLD